MTNREEQERALEALIRRIEDGVRPPYPEPRGTCPECGSGNVTHVRMLMTRPAAFDFPEWVEHRSCRYLGPPRVCADCGHGWAAQESDAASGLPRKRRG